MRRLSDGGEGADYSITDELAQLVDDRKLAAKLAGYMQRSEFEPFAVMIEQDSPSEEMYFIESGQATVELRGPGDTRIRLKTLGPGAIVGEIAFYLGGTRTASVVARSKVVVWQFSRTALAKAAAGSSRGRSRIPQGNGFHARRPAVEHQPAGAVPDELEHVPEKCTHFSDKNVLQVFDPAHFLIGEVIPLAGNVRGGREACLAQS